MRPTWAEVSLSALQKNFQAITALLAGRAKIEVCCVVKADAYGHGAIECARALEDAGARWFGVSTADEGVLLRQAGITGGILLMSGFSPGEQDAVTQNHLTAAVWEPRQIELLNAAAETLHSAKHPSAKPLSVHLKIDTGMSRLGAGVPEVNQLLLAAKNAQHITIAGIFTHLASAELLDSPQTDSQLKQFDQALATVKASGLSPEFIHVANSTAIMTRPETWKNMVRPGGALYGYRLPMRGTAQPNNAAASFQLQPVLTWKTRILSLRSVRPGQAVSYGAAYVARAAGRIAVLPVGYADGFSRHLSGKARVIVRNQYAPVVGNVTMDLTMVDVSGVEGIEIGDEVILIGRGEGQDVGRSPGQSLSVTADDHASWAGTISFEILCGISRRVPRKYLRGSSENPRGSPR